MNRGRSLGAQEQADELKKLKWESKQQGRGLVSLTGKITTEADDDSSMSLTGYSYNDDTIKVTKNKTSRIDEL